MKRLILTLLVLAYLAPQALRADDADLDDAAAEPKPIKEARVNRPKDNFGSKVSEEAKRFHNDDTRTEKNFGEWVSNQRSHRPDRLHGRPETAGDKARNEERRPSK